MDKGCVFAQLFSFFDLRNLRFLIWHKVNGFWFVKKFLSDRAKRKRD
jgi:hypothetical protein